MWPACPDQIRTKTCFNHQTEWKHKYTYVKSLVTECVTKSVHVTHHIQQPVPPLQNMLSLVTRSPAQVRVRAFHASTPARSSGHGHYHVRRLIQTNFTILKCYAWNNTAHAIQISRRQKVRICG